MQVAQRQLRRPFSTGLRAKDIPGPKAWPLLGALPDFLQRTGGMAPPKGPMMLKAHDGYYKEFGSIYKLSLPGDEQIAVCRPETFMQMYRNEGMYPVGGFSLMWPMVKWAEETKKQVYLDWIGAGEPWRKIRLTMQEDIIGPRTARTYLPYINEAMRMASPHLPHFKDEPDVFVTRVAFDMFCSLFYGVQMKTASPSPDPEHIGFVKDTSEAFRLLGQGIFQPHLKKSIFKYHPFNKKFTAALERSYAYSSKLMDQALEMSKQAPTEATKPYIVRVLERESMPVESIKEVAASVLQAGIDTTRSVINWNLLYLATHPEKQEPGQEKCKQDLARQTLLCHVDATLAKSLNPICPQELLRRELRETLGDGDLTEDVAANMKIKLPYLRGVIRETHRVAPPTSIMTARPALSDLVLDGYNVPAGATVLFNAFSVQNDPGSLSVYIFF